MDVPRGFDPTLILALNLIGTAGVKYGVNVPIAPSERHRRAED